MRRILLAPDSFKGTLTAQEVCAIWQSAARAHLPGVEILSLPISDGGEGLISVLQTALGGTLVTQTVSDPLFRPIKASYLLLADGTAIVELAACSGLPLLAPGERDPRVTSTAGLGQLIAHALDSGATALVLGLGGSATNDGGAGAASALGLRLLDGDGAPISPTGGGLSRLAHMDASALHPKLRGLPVTIACDVENPLCGPSGASAVYGPQKGATAQQVTALDKNLAHYAALLERDCGRHLAERPGSGAAGGAGLPFLAYGDTTLRSGIDIVLDLLDFDRHLEGCSLVLTGEGRTDAQSAMGKALSGVCRRAQRQQIPVVVLSGGLGEGAEALYPCGASALLSACPAPMPLETALARAAENLALTADNFFRLLAHLA